MPALTEHPAPIKRVHPRPLDLAFRRVSLISSIERYRIAGISHSPSAEAERCDASWSETCDHEIGQLTIELAISLLRHARSQETQAPALRDPIDRPSRRRRARRRAVMGQRIATAAELRNLNATQTVHDPGTIDCTVFLRSGISGCEPRNHSSSAARLRARTCTFLPVQGGHALSQTGLSNEAIAARFGVTSTVVATRLELARVSRQIIAAYRAGDIDPECVIRPRGRSMTRSARRRSSSR